MTEDTWDDVHAGDVIIGHDGQAYGVEDICPDPVRGPTITLIRHGIRTGPAQPPPGTPIRIAQRAETSGEAYAFGVLAAAGLNPQVIRESYR